MHCATSFVLGKPSTVWVSECDAKLGVSRRCLVALAACLPVTLGLWAGILYLAARLIG